jgi:hypothetical protein
MSHLKEPCVLKGMGGRSTCDVLFWNVHGQVTKTVGNKFTDDQFLNVCKNFDILGLAELHTNSKPSIKGFKLIKDKIRQKTHKGPKISGGIAVFAKKEIAHMIKHVPNKDEDSIWVKLTKETTGEMKDVYIGTCYASPAPRNSLAKSKNSDETNDKHTSLERFFEEATQFSMKGEVILQGDINARTGDLPDFLTKDKFDDYFGIVNNEKNPPRNSEDKKVCERGSLLLDLCRSGDYRIANGRKLGDLSGKFTSMQWNGSAVVDYVITQAANFSRVVEFKVGHFFPCLSDHCPLQYKLKINVNRNESTDTVVMQKMPPRCKWNPLTKQSFLEALKSETVKQTFETTLRQETLSPESGISELSSVLLECAACKPSTSENPTKRKRKTTSTNDQPWFDKECKAIKKKINTLANQLKRKPADTLIRENLFVTKKKFKNMTKMKKTIYKKNIIEKMHLTKQSEIKQFWKLLNKLDLEKSNRNISTDINPKEWMDHYTNLLQGATNGKIPDNTAESGPLDYEVTIEEIMDARGILKPGKATGVDIVNNEMILEALNMYPEAFRNVINILLKQGVGVTQWLTSLLVPIHKKGSTDDPDNYRGIALISCLAKLFYAVLNNRLLDFCLKHKILSPSQLGFLAGNRTSDAHIILHNLINEYCHKRGRKIYGCFVDFSKAFDSIPRDRMFQKLLDIGVTGKFYDIIKYIYEGDQVCIKLDDMITPAIKTIMGVRQGCVLSPLLFNIYMADFPSSLSQNVGVQLTDNSNINCILWADDIILLSESEEGLNILLAELKAYSDTNQLKVNTDKTKCMIFNKTGRLIRRNFYLGTTRLENVRNYKYLGLIITPSGEIRSALDDLRSRAHKAYMALKNKLGVCFRDHIEDTIMLFDSLVKPILLYGSDFWGCLKAPQNNPIENLHMQFCRQLLGVQKNTTNSGVLLELGRTPLMLEARRLSLKNWDRIKNEKGNILVTKSYQNACTKELDWNETVCGILSKYGMQYRITESVSDLGNAFFGKAKDIFHQEALGQISEPKSKLRTYALIKQNIGREDYLKEIKNTKHRQMLTKLRLSNHQLMIEQGRHKKLPKEERICQICHEGIEDEIHFLIKCSQLQQLREPLLAACSEIRPQFGYYSDEEKFILIMTTPLLMGNVSKFIHSAFKERER